jgi:hypothetical protein
MRKCKDPKTQPSPAEWDKKKAKSKKMRHGEEVFSSSHTPNNPTTWSIQWDGGKAAGIAIEKGLVLHTTTICNVI